MLYLQSICSLGVPFIFESPIIHSLILRFPSFSSLKTLNTETKNFMITLFYFLITSILNKTKNSVIVLLREENVIWLEIQESFLRNPR